MSGKEGIGTIGGYEGIFCRWEDVCVYVWRGERNESKNEGKNYYEPGYLHQIATNIYFHSGHSATVGCSKCKKKFPGSFGNKNFSEFNRRNWESRKNEKHRGQMNETDAKRKVRDMSVHVSYNLWLLLLIMVLAFILFNVLQSMFSKPVCRNHLWKLISVFK